MVLALIVNLDREQDAPVTGAHRIPEAPMKRVHIADAGFSEMPFNLEVDLRARSRRKLRHWRMADGGWRADVNSISFIHSLSS